MMKLRLRKGADSKLHLLSFFLRATNSFKTTSRLLDPPSAISAKLFMFSSSTVDMETGGDGQPRQSWRQTSVEHGLSAASASSSNFYKQ